MLKLDANGNAILATTAGTIARGLYIAVETVDNSAGSADGDLDSSTVQVETPMFMQKQVQAINFGRHCKTSRPIQTCVAISILAPETHVGRYIGHENEELILLMPLMEML